MKRYLLLISVMLALMIPVVACGDDDKSTVAGPDEALSLVINLPQDEAVVGTSRITVSGTARSDAVISINGVITDVDSQGNFAAEVNLEMGPNLIEAVASDFEGHSSTETITVIYIP